LASLLPFGPSTFGRSEISPTAASFAARSSPMPATQRAVSGSSGDWVALALCWCSTFSFTASAVFWLIMPSRNAWRFLPLTNKMRTLPFASFDTLAINAPSVRRAKPAGWRLTSTPHAQADPKFQTPFAYTRITAKAVRDALLAIPELDGKVPTRQTVGDILNRLGYNLRRVQKARPQKNCPRRTPSSPR
jgi:hypothetical protein